MLQNVMWTHGTEQHSSADKNSGSCRKFTKNFKEHPVINIKQQSIVIINYIIIGKLIELPNGFSI